MPVPTIEELQEKAVKYFQQRPSNFPEGRPYNCCESVLLVLAEYLRHQIRNYSQNCNRYRCRLFIKRTYMWHNIRSYNSHRHKIWQRDRELTGLDIKTSEGFKEYYKSVHDYTCTERVKFAVKKAMELLE